MIFIQLSVAISFPITAFGATLFGEAIHSNEILLRELVAIRRNIIHLYCKESPQFVYSH